MSFHKILQTLWITFLSALLFGCATGNAPSNDGFENIDNSATYSKHHHRHSKSALAPDNPASVDYFRNQPVSTESDSNLWSAMKSNFQLQHYPNSPAVKAQIYWFMHNQSYLNRTARRAAPYMYYIYQETKARHLPSELILLPIIESAYNPFVSSYAGAAGLWQLEPGTARSFGLRQDWWYDGRKDISTSTKAALDYLSYLQNYFGGDWLLAIAAYDTGEGNVQSAIRHNARQGLETDFWSLFLASETKAYVPKLLALCVIVSNPHEYGITLPFISNAPYLGEVEIGSQMNLAKVANLAGVSLEELQTLNPGYKQTTLDPHQPYKLLLPIDRIPTFKRNLLNNTEGNVSTDNTNGLWNRYKIQSGDTWNKIAKRFNTSITLLQSVNHLDSPTPPEGKVLLIPETSFNQSAFAAAITQEAKNTPSVPSVETAPEMPEANDMSYHLPEITTPEQEEASAKTSSSKTIENKGLHLKKTIHIVKQGETLSSIAKVYKISKNELAHWNNYSSNRSLTPGKKLIIWQKEKQEKHTNEIPTSHQTENHIKITHTSHEIYTHHTHSKNHSYKHSNHVTQHHKK